MTSNETYGNDWTDTLAARERGEVAGFQGADETNEAFAARTARDDHPAGAQATTVDVAALAADVEAATFVTRDELAAALASAKAPAKKVAKRPAKKVAAAKKAPATARAAKKA